MTNLQACEPRCLAATAAATAQVHPQDLAALRALAASRLLAAWRAFAAAADGRSRPFLASRQRRHRCRSAAAAPAAASRGVSAAFELVAWRWWVGNQLLEAAHNKPAVATRLCTNTKKGGPGGGGGVRASEQGAAKSQHNRMLARGVCESCGPCAVFSRRTSHIPYRWPPVVRPAAPASCMRFLISCLSFLRLACLAPVPHHLIGFHILYTPPPTHTWMHSS